jgi:hypothetical protein
MGVEVKLQQLNGRQEDCRFGRRRRLGAQGSCKASPNTLLLPAMSTAKPSSSEDILGQKVHFELNIVSFDR